MPRNINSFTNDLKQVFKAAQAAATKRSFDPSIVNGTDTMEQLTIKVANATAEAFSDALAGPLASLIHSYMDDQFIDVTGLSAPNGPVQGIAKVVG